MRSSGTSRARRGRRVDRRSRAARAEGRDARQDLLAAAAEVFLARGFHAASIDEVAERAGYSKGTVYWHFEGKDDLFLALVEEHVERPTREMIDLLRSAPPDRDMAPEASRRFAELLAGQREWLLLQNEYWLQALRDPGLRKRYAGHRSELRAALGDALVSWLHTLGAGHVEGAAGKVATAIMALDIGLAQQALLDPQAVPDDLLGETIELIYEGLLARAERSDAAGSPPA